MSAFFFSVAEEQGWDDASQCAVLERYIDNQQSYDVFDDYVCQIEEDQGDCRDEWDDDTMVSVMLEYIENQQSDEAFRDFLIEQQVQENQRTD